MTSEAMTKKKNGKGIPIQKMIRKKNDKRRDKSEVCIIAKPDTSAKEHFGVENARDPFGNFDVDDKL